MDKGSRQHRDNSALSRFDEEQREGGLIVAGTDEAGRGPLAGPVVAAALILPPGLSLPGVDDSKKLGAEARKAAFERIIDAAVSWAAVEISAADVDRLNPLGASMEAMRRAVLALSPRPDLVLVDGNRKPELPMRALAVVKGDSVSLSIAAASILAKVTRDRLMDEANKKWPEYNFGKHKGYGTREHLEALKKYGPCPCHRRTFRGVLPPPCPRPGFDFGGDDD